MTFADELRSSKGPQLTKEEIACRQYWMNFHVKAVLEELKRLARSQNNAGKHSRHGIRKTEVVLNISSKDCSNTDKSVLIKNCENK